MNLTRIMTEVRELLKKISVKLIAPGFQPGGEEIVVTFWNLYSQEEVMDIATMSALYEMKKLP